MNPIESLLSARLFLSPEQVGDRIYFISNLSGHMSLYAMDHGGSVPEPLLPPQIALQNPTLMNGSSFKVFPGLGKIMVMIDQNGDEAYKPTLIPIEGGYPEPLFAETFADQQVTFFFADVDENQVYFTSASRSEPIRRAYRAFLNNGQIDLLYEGTYGGFVAGYTDDHENWLLLEALGAGDHVAYLKQGLAGEKTLIYGVPIESREAGQEVPPNSFSQAHFIEDDQAIIFHNSIFSDTYGIGYLQLEPGSEAQAVEIIGQQHEGLGELEGFEHLDGDHFLIAYNIDGCSWLYRATYDSAAKRITLGQVVVGQGTLSGGILKGHNHEASSDRIVISYTTATSPPQLYTIEADGTTLTQHTRERVLGIAESELSPGEDASFTSFDGLRVSARLYLPDESLGFEGPRPLVYYIHGGPQSQEHPDFAWFSMPLVQILTMRGFAVFVPNVRGSTGYGFAYMKRVIKDWGGGDRLDHVHAMTEFLPNDARLDTSRAGVVGRSYGGFMTLTLAGRHPELWKAACDMFGPYDLLTFADRVPATWKPFIAALVGDPVENRDFMIERSPKTYLEQLACPMLVIQGKNDPRVIEQESRELVEFLRGQGKEVDYLMFEDEGHDVLKFENRIRCYQAIVDLFAEHLQPED
jgi:pimeloyl-ACP methyl ester carboxylesterase